MVFKREPEWHFSFAADRLLKSPLRRPFIGDGALLRFAIHDGTDAQTLLTRDTRVAVQESAVMRWLGSLGATAMGEFAGGAETAENAFLAELFAALRTDIDRPQAGTQAGTK